MDLSIKKGAFGALKKKASKKVQGWANFALFPAAFAMMAWSAQFASGWAFGRCVTWVIRSFFEFGWVRHVCKVLHYAPHNLGMRNGTVFSQSVFPLLAAVVGIWFTVWLGKKAVQVTLRLGALLWDRNSFCRGWLILGTTGSGKTECGINIILHGLFQNEKGKERKAWETDPVRVEWLSRIEGFKAKEKEVDAAIEDCVARIDGVLLDKATGKRGEKGPDGKPCLNQRRLAIVSEVVMAEAKNLPTLAAKKAELERAEAEIEKVRKGVSDLSVTLLLARRSLNEFEDKIKDLRFELYPFGGLCLDQKGMFWEVLLKIARHYGRDADLCLLQTRPDGADERWSPPARFNLISYTSVPANTYAAAFVKTAQAMSGGEGDKGFFKVQAETNIGWGIELMRAIDEAQQRLGWHKDPSKKAVRCIPAMDKVLDLLTAKKVFWAECERWGAYVQTATREKAKAEGLPEPRSAIKSERITRALTHFDLKYWSQPEEQLGGVMGTIQTYISYFTGQDVAEVFCRDNTFDLGDIEKGKLICIAMPQKLAIERRYVATIMKILFYQHAQRRFDRFGEDSKKFNLIVCFQDEWQRFAIPEDGDVDTLRQAQATTLCATQDLESVFPVLGGKEKAQPILLNLRNRMIGRCAEEAGAESLASFIGKTLWREKTYSVSNGVSRSVNYSYKEDFRISASQLRNLSDFTFVVTHAGGALKKYVIMPRTTDFKMPFWWPTKAENIKNESSLLAWRMRLVGNSAPFTEIKLPKEVFRTPKKRRDRA